LEHTRTSPDKQGAASAPGAVPGIGSENARDPAHESIEQSGGVSFEQPRPEPVSVETAVEEEIMSKLPRKRPQRRSTRRPAASGARKGSAKRTTASKKSTGKRASTARSSRATAKAKNSPSVPEQALGAAISTARFPLRVGAGLAKRANSLIGRIR
jgi:hypothetical protein